LIQAGLCPGLINLSRVKQPGRLEGCFPVDHPANYSLDDPLDYDKVLRVYGEGGDHRSVIIRLPSKGISGRRA
jgi:hypothetical protein